MVDEIRETGECVSPPALDDLLLITAVDGEAEADVMAHLRSCPHCMERARVFADLQGLLSTRLYRMLCPSSDELLAFQQGWLESRRQAFLRDHLHACPHCTADLRLLTEAANTPVLLPPDPLGGVRRIIARLLGPSPTASLTPVYGALRGTARGGQYAYRAENIEIMLEVERAVGRSDHLVVFGLLMLDNGMDNVSRGSASLLYNDMVVNSALLDEMGNFMLDDIAPGDYSLSLRLPDCEVLVEALTL